MIQIVVIHSFTIILWQEETLVQCDFGERKVWQICFKLNRFLIIWDGWIWYLPNLPNFLPAKLSYYTVAIAS